VSKEKPPLKLDPIPGEPTRYNVHSRTTEGDLYTVDVVEGTCPCEGFKYRKTCSHLREAREFHARFSCSHYLELPNSGRAIYIERSLYDSWNEADRKKWVDETLASDVVQSPS
jgi:hypothetical protein